MKKSILSILLLASLGVMGYKEEPNISEVYWDKYMQTNKEFLEALRSGKSAYSLDKINMKSQLYFEVYQKTRP